MTESSFLYEDTSKATSHSTRHNATSPFINQESSNEDGIFYHNLSSHQDIFSHPSQEQQAGEEGHSQSSLTDSFVQEDPSSDPHINDYHHQSTSQNGNKTFSLVLPALPNQITRIQQEIGIKVQSGAKKQFVLAPSSIAIISDASDKDVTYSSKSKTQKKRSKGINAEDTTEEEKPKKRGRKKRSEAVEIDEDENFELASYNELNLDIDQSAVIKRERPKRTMKPRNYKYTEREYSDLDDSEYDDEDIKEQSSIDEGHEDKVVQNRNYSRETNEKGNERLASMTLSPEEEEKLKVYLESKLSDEFDHFAHDGEQDKEKESKSSFEATFRGRVGVRSSSKRATDTTYSDEEISASSISAMKSKPKRKEADTSSKITDKTSTIDSSTLSNPPIKRGRGRPPKNKDFITPTQLSFVPDTKSLSERKNKRAKHFHDEDEDETDSGKEMKRMDAFEIRRMKEQSER